MGSTMECEQQGKISKLYRRNVLRDNRFGRLGRRVVKGCFDGGSMTCDGGVMSLGAKRGATPRQRPYRSAHNLLKAAADPLNQVAHISGLAVFDSLAVQV